MGESPLPYPQNNRPDTNIFPNKFVYTAPVCGYGPVNAPDNPPPVADFTADLTAWIPWSQELNDIIESVRTIGCSTATGARRRVLLNELGERAQQLLEQAGCQPALPGLFGRALDVLRAPIKAEPIHIAEALARLGCLAALVQPLAVPTISVASTPSRRSKRRCVDQQTLPGLETSTTKEQHQ
jgi:hypothetical protein